MDTGQEFLNQVLANRNLPENFLQLDDPCHNFYLLPSSSAVLNRIKLALENKQKVLIWGDQDVDGITATAILSESLKQHNPHVVTHIPDRGKQGIGFNLDILKKLINRHQPNLVITVDCCSRDLKAAKYLEQQGIDFIITDHHEIDHELLLELEHCHGFMNCKRTASEYPFPYLAGCGISLKISLNFSQNEYLWILAMLGTIADRVPLRDENRTIVKKGLLLVNSLQPQNLVNLLYPDCKNFPLSVNDIKQYLISPLSSDFIDQSKSAALEVLTETSSSDYAAILVQRSREWNQQRMQGIEIAGEKAELLGDFAFCYLPEFPRSLLGTIANYLSKIYSKPAIVIGNLNQGLQTVEARTVAGEILSVLDAHSSLFTSHGGHLKAAGASIPHQEIETFRSSLANYKYPLNLTRKLRVDVKMSKLQAIPEILELLAQLGPFGQDFPEISIEIPDFSSPSPVDNRNIFLLDELGKLRPAEIIDDIWEFTCSP
ncbi:MAG: DHH family phosphoesterase [bacterium]